MEEYVASHITNAGDLLFMWQVAPSVIIGRNQVLQNEVNLDYCKAHGIRVFRRKSGGGCVYADEQNLMLSYVTTGDDVPFIYNRFMGMLVLVLRKLGVEAVRTSHNDVMIGGRKVSGTAFYHLPTGRNIVHGTMLYDTDMNHMLGALTPSREKLQKNGIGSVRQRITLLKVYVSLSFDEFKAHVRETLCDDEYRLTEADVRAVEAMEKNYVVAI
jgi:lipoic acid synthetase/lipoate-protein ligase A